MPLFTLLLQHIGKNFAKSYKVHQRLYFMHVAQMFTWLTLNHEWFLTDNLYYLLDLFGCDKDIFIASQTSNLDIKDWNSFMFLEEISFCLSVSGNVYIKTLLTTLIEQRNSSLSIHKVTLKELGIWNISDTKLKEKLLFFLKFSIGKYTSLTV